MVSAKVKKNLLDLEYTKSLQHFNTTLIIVATYFIGLVVALITQTIDYTNTQRLPAIIFLSIILLGTGASIMHKIYSRMEDIVTEIKKLRM